MHYINKFQESLKQISFAFNDMNFDVELKYGVTMCKKDEAVDTLVQRVEKALGKAKKSRITDIEYLL
jgi:PleD family two-component response regulator